MKPRYRWFYSANFINQKRPTICACLLEDEETGLGGIGISICSDSDNPFYRRGRGQAFSRAHRAFIADIPGEPIKRTEAIRVILGTTIPVPPTYKSIPSGNQYFDRLRGKFWPRREEGKEESHMIPTKIEHLTPHIDRIAWWQLEGKTVKEMAHSLAWTERRIAKFMDANREKLAIRLGEIKKAGRKGHEESKKENITSPKRSA